MKKTNKILTILGCTALGLAGIGVAKTAMNSTVQTEATATTVTKTIAAIATANSWVNSTAYTSWALDSNVTISTTGTGNSGKYYSSGSGTWRLYQAGTGNLIVTVAAGYTLTSVKATYAVSNTGTLTGLASGTAVTVSGASVTYPVGNTGTATNGNVQISELSVTYDVSTDPAIAFNAPDSELVKGAKGTFTATTANVTSPTLTWASSDACITVNSATGAYTANGYGTSTITVSMVVSGKTYSDSAAVSVNADVTIAQANTIGTALASGATTTYTVNVSGTISAVATSSVTISDGTNTLLVYGTYSPANAASKGWGVGGTISFKGNINNYSSTVELKNPSFISYTGNALALANFVMMAETANQCKTQFTIAKTQYFAMTAAEQTLFKTAQTGEAAVITNGRARYEAWAVNQGAEPYTENSTPAIAISKDESSSYIAYGVSGLMLLVTLGAVVVIRKKKQA
jgi:hypothetical protein